MRTPSAPRMVALLLLCVLLLSCGLTAFAAEESDVLPIEPTATDQPPTDPPPTDDVPPDTALPPDGTEIPPSAEDTPTELYPADVQTIIEDETRQIVKTYILTDEENPSNISRESFIREGWLYTLADITQTRSAGNDTRLHAETVEINTDTKDLNAIIPQLAPTMEFQSEDGYCGIIVLDLASVKCEAAGYKTNSYTVSATRQYPRLPSNDPSLIPKTIKESGRTLTLSDIKWKEHTTTIDSEDIPQSYTATVTYTGTASKTVTTGYVTTADYTGTLSKLLIGDTVYTAYFLGTEINPAPTPESVEPTDPPDSVTQHPSPSADGTADETPTPPPVSDTAPDGTPAPTSAPNDEPHSIPIALLVLVGLLAALLAGGIVYFFLRHNVKIYVISDRGRVL